MSAPHSFLLVIDLSVLLSVRSKEWQEFAKIGECYLPVMVFEEMKFLSKRAPEPEQEKAAREFLRFYPHSRWQQTTESRSHPSLTPVGGEALSKKARLSLTVAECAYGLAHQQRSSGGFVVLVADDHNLLQRAQAVRSPNLCGIPVTALIQWARTGQIPPVITQKQQLTGTATASRRSTVSSSRAAYGSNTATRIATAPRYSVNYQATGTGFASQVVPSLLSLAGLVVVGLGLWWVFDPTGFNRYWQQPNLPFVGQPTRSNSK